MSVKERLEWLARQAARRPVLTVTIVFTLALAGGLLALGLRPSAGSDTLVSRSSSSFQTTEQDHRDFGNDGVIILVREPLTDLVETKDLAALTFLEACLGGQYAQPSQRLYSFELAPAGSHAPYGGWGSPCGKLAKARPVQVVYGPGTFLNRAVTAVRLQVQALLDNASQAVKTAQSNARQLALGRGLSRSQADAAANAAGTLESERQGQQLGQLALNSGLTSLPKIDDPQFISQVVFDQTRGVNQPKSRFAYLFPTAKSALIQVRLKASLTDAQQADAISWIRQAVRMPMFRLAYGGTYTVTGAPVVINDLATEISGAIGGLLIAVVLVMAATLLIVFRGPLRLLPLAIALAAAGITFGALWIVGGTLTMASIAVLPILIGLAVDYAIQFQSRVQEARRELGARFQGHEQAVARAAATGAPTIAAAALATATGFLVLLLSPVPMVRGFGLLLVVGIAIALVCALTAGSAALVLADRDGGRAGAALRGVAERVRGGALGASLRGAAELVRAAIGKLGRWSRRAVPRPRWRGSSISTRSRALLQPDQGVRRAAPKRLLAVVVRRPATLIVVGALLAVVGWVADTQTPVQSDVTKLVPASMPALRDLHTLEHVTGVSGEIDVIVQSHNVATPRVVNWMLGYEAELQKHYGYLETNGCAKSTLCPALSLPDLFSAGGSNAASSQSAINNLLAAVPTYFKQAVITRDQHRATLAFGIRLMPLSKQQRVIDYMSSRLRPPAGVTARLAGLPVLAAQANSALSSSARRLLTLLAGLIAVGLVLLVVFRSLARALVPLVPIAFATGWSALILFVIGIPLNPMSATLGTLVIAISTEFSVLLAERFRQERMAGLGLTDALIRTYRSTGLAVLASGITAIAGFGVLVLSSITMLRDFGFVTLVDLSVSLAGVLLVLPAVLVVSEREDLVGSSGRALRRLGASLPRLRRRARMA